MDDLLKYLMNKGFIIYEIDAETYEEWDKFYILTKYSTPHDSRTVISEEFEESKHSTWEEAIDEAKKVSGWNNPFIGKTDWSLQMLFQHYGLGFQIVDLESIKASSYIEAKVIGKIFAQKFIEENFKKGEIEKWETRLKPLKS